MLYARIVAMFSATIGYSLVFNVYVFRLLLRLALHRNNVAFMVHIDSGVH